MHQTRTGWRGGLVIAVVLVSISMAQATGAGVHDAAGFFSREALATAEQQIAVVF
jgi:hypothetical protein